MYKSSYAPVDNCILYIKTDLYVKDVSLALAQGSISTDMLKKELDVPYHIAVMIIDQILDNGIISEGFINGIRRRFIIGIKQK